MNRPENSKPPHPSLYAGMWLTHHPVSRRLYWRYSWIGRSSENSQLSMPSLRGQLMSSGLQAMGWRPSGWLGWWYICCAAPHWSNCPLLQAMDGCISRHGTTSSCQSAVTSRIVKRCCSRGFSCKQRYSKYLRPLPLPLCRDIFAAPFIKRLLNAEAHHRSHGRRFVRHSFNMGTAWGRGLWP